MPSTFALRGFGVADAAHLAYAEKAEACFMSCDDKLIKKVHYVFYYKNLGR